MAAMPTPAEIGALVTVNPGSVGSFQIMPTPVAARSKLQSELCESQFHWPRTKTVTVPSGLGWRLPWIVPRIGFPASARAVPGPDQTALVTSSAPPAKSATRRRTVPRKPLVLATISFALFPLARWRAIRSLAIYGAQRPRECTKGGIPVKIFLMEHRIALGGSHRIRPRVIHPKAGRTASAAGRDATGRRGRETPRRGCGGRSLGMRGDGGKAKRCRIPAARAASSRAALRRRRERRTPRRDDAQRLEGALDGLGRTPVAPAEVVGAHDHQVVRDARQEVAREVPRSEPVVRGGERARLCGHP